MNLDIKPATVRRQFDTAGPLLTISRVPQLEPETNVAPVLKLQPRPDPSNRRSTVGAGAPRADVIDIGRADERRKVAAIANSVGQAVIEVLGGIRPIGQLSRLLDASSFERLALRAAMVREQRERHKLHPQAAVHRLHRSAQVRSVHLCRLNAEAYEASLVVHEQTRSRAVAIRLEYSKELWKITALEVG